MRRDGHLHVQRHPDPKGSSFLENQLEEELPSTHPLSVSRSVTPVSSTSLQAPRRAVPLSPGVRLTIAQDFLRQHPSVTFMWLVIFLFLLL